MSTQQIPYHVLHPFVFNIAHSGIHGCFFKACPRSDLVITLLSFSRMRESRGITANHVSIQPKNVQNVVTQLNNPI